MSTYIRRYAKYLNEKAFSYRQMAFDFCKVKRGFVESLCLFLLVIFTFHVSRRRRKMYSGHARLCVCVCVFVWLSAAACPHYCANRDVTWGSGRGCP